VATIRRGRAVWDNRLRALSLDEPVTSHSWSNKTGLSPFDMALRAVANFLVISVRAFIESPFSMGRECHGYAGIPKGGIGTTTRAK